MVDLASKTPINSPSPPLSPQVTGTRTRSTTVVLGLPESTVKNHLSKIGCKFHAADRAHIVALSLRAGVID